jgi:hypothetical protein
MPAFVWTDVFNREGASRGFLLGWTVWAHGFEYAAYQEGEEERIGLVVDKSGPAD